MFGGLFKGPTFLDRDVEAWHLETWQDLKSRLAGDVRLEDTPVVLPTRDFFPASDATGHERAQHIFETVKGLMQMQDWPCDLYPQEERDRGTQLSAFVVTEGSNQPNGTFWISPEGQAIITYAPDLIDQPMQLVATLAHELSHYLLSGHEDLVEDETHELMTDLTVAYTGFGVFGANSAFQFSQHGDAFSQGWQWQRNGYLSPRSWAFALAVFGALRGGDGDMGKHLRPEVEADRRKALSYLNKRPELLAAIREV